jgi:hypothetical protein
MDAAQFADWHHGFAHYHEQPALAAAILPYVYFQDPPAAGSPAASPPATFPTPVTSPAKETFVGPRIQESAARKPKARELWVDELPAPGPPRNAVELGFEKDR